MRKTWLPGIGMIAMLMVTLKAAPWLVPRYYLAAYSAHPLLITDQDAAISALHQKLEQGGPIRCADFIFYGFPSPWGKTVPVYTPEPDDLLQTNRNIMVAYPFASTDALGPQRIKSMARVATYNSLLLQRCPENAG